MASKTVAAHAGIAPETLSRILSGNVRNPSFAVVERIVRAIGVSWSEVFDAPPLELSAGQMRQMRDAAELMVRLLDRAPAPPGRETTCRVPDDAMRGAAILEGDLLYVRKVASLRDAEGRIVVCEVGGELVVRRLVTRGRRLELRGEHPGFPPIAVDDEDRFELLGVVVRVVRDVR